MYKKIIKELRAYDLTLQEDLAKKLNIKSGVYSDYECENKIFPSKHLITICDEFNASLDYVFEFTNIKHYKKYFKGFDKQKAGQRLKEFRIASNLTQVELAKFLNTVQPVIANYENGKNLIATPFLYQICSKYKISADYLLGKIDIIPKWTTTNKNKINITINGK